MENGIPDTYENLLTQYFEVREKNDHWQNRVAELNLENLAQSDLIVKLEAENAQLRTAIESVAEIF